MYRTCVGHIQQMCRKYQEMCRKCHLRICVVGFPQNAFCLSCMQEMCPTHQISCVQEMCLKCHLYCVLILSFMPPNLVIGYVPEMYVSWLQDMYLKCHLYWLQEICLKFCPILYQEMSRKCQNFLE